KAAVELLPAIKAASRLRHISVVSSLETLDPGYHPLDGWRPTAALNSSSSSFLPAFELVTLDWAPSLGSADERARRQGLHMMPSASLRNAERIVTQRLQRVPTSHSLIKELIRLSQRILGNPMSKRVALITGTTGQDGAYLAEFLLNKGYVVHGIKRRSSSFNTGRVDHLYQDPHEVGVRFVLHYGDMTDATSLIRIVQDTQPDEIYNLAAQSHVPVSFETPEYTANADGLGTLRLLE